MAAWHNLFPGNGHAADTVRHQLVQYIDFDGVDTNPAVPFATCYGSAKPSYNLDKVEITLQPPPTVHMTCIR